MPASFLTWTTWIRCICKTQSMSFFLVVNKMWYTQDCKIKWVWPKVLRRPRIHALQWMTAWLPPARVSLKCDMWKKKAVLYVIMACVLFLTVFISFYFLRFEIVTNLIRTWNWKLNAELSQDIFTRSSKLHWFTGQQMRALALKLTNSPSCILYG